MSTTEDHVRMLRTRMANEEAASAKDARRIEALEASVKALEQADRRTPVQRFFDEGEPKPSAVKAQLDERIDRLQNQVNAVAVEAHRRLCKLEPAAPGAVENPVENPPPPETPNPPTIKPEHTRPVPTLTPEPEPPDDPRPEPDQRDVSAPASMCDRCGGGMVWTHADGIDTRCADGCDPDVDPQQGTARERRIAYREKLAAWEERHRTPEPPDDPWNPPAATLSEEVNRLRKRASMLERATAEHARALEWTQDRLRELRLGVARRDAR